MKRSIAILLAVLMLLGALSGIGAATNEVSEASADAAQQEELYPVEELVIDALDSDAEHPPEDFGTVIDPETG